MKLTVRAKAILRDRITPGSTLDQTVAIYAAGNPYLLKSCSDVMDDYLLIQLRDPLNGRCEWFVDAGAVSVDQPQPTRRRPKNAHADTAA